MSESEVLENLCKILQEEMQVAGVIIIVAHTNKRAEFVGALQKDLSPVQVLEPVLEALKNGDGIPLGGNGESYQSSCESENTPNQNH